MRWCLLSVVPDSRSCSVSVSCCCYHVVLLLRSFLWLPIACKIKFRLLAFTALLITCLSCFFLIYLYSATLCHLLALTRAIKPYPCLATGMDTLFLCLHISQSIQSPHSSSCLPTLESLPHTLSC